MTKGVRPGLLAASVAGALACHSVTGPDAGPLCLNPAPLSGTFDPRAPNYLVQFQPGVDSTVETARLGAKYGFQAKNVYTTAISGFSAALSPDVADAIRCEPTVKLMEHDQVVTLIF